VPADVASLLSRLSLSQYGPKLVSELGVCSCSDLALLSEDELKAELPEMKLAERKRLLAEVKPPPASAAAPPQLVRPPGVAASAAAPASQPVAVRALVIGINAYGNPVPGGLANAVNDARAVCKALSALPGAAATLVTDCTRAELEQALKDFRDGVGRCEGRGMRVASAPSAQAASSPVLGIVFFAGHGLQVSGKNYLVPSDFAVPTQNAKLDIMLRDTAKACVALGEVEQALEDAGMFAGAVLLDCCRNVPDFLAELGATRSAGTRALPMGMADCKASTENLLVAFATAPGTCALDRSSRLPDHSPFTAALLRTLEAPRRVNDLGMHLVDEVLRDTEKRQRPQTAASFGTEAGSILLG
jgi:uncharacterized caspase-like protein